jgi:hypothetical protein
VAYTFNPYQSDYTSYGYQPQHNWFDFLYGQTPPADGSPSGGGGAGGAGGGGGTSGLPAGALAALLGQQGGQQGNPSPGPMSGGPVTPTGQTVSPHAGTDPLSPTTGGALKGIANMLDPTPGNLLASAADFGYDPEGYVDTKPMTIPGVGTLATAPGPVQGFLGALPFGGALANTLGSLTANKLAEIANASRAGTEGFGIGKYDDMYGRSRIAGISPGPFGYGSVMTGPAGPAQFGWAGTHKIMQDLQNQNRDPARSRPTGAPAPGQTAASHGRAGMGQRGVGGGRDSRGGGRGGEQNRGGAGTGGGQPKGATSDRPDRLAHGGKVGALAAYGRGDDDSLAHVAEGELMLPPEFQRRHPGVLNMIHRAMSDEGMDPRDYRAGDVIDVNPHTGLPEFGFWKTIKQNVLPVAAGAATSYLTGSDILGGLAAGVGSKLMGADWGEAIGMGALTGLGSAGLGLSGEGPGMLGELLGQTAVNGSATGPGGMFGGVNTASATGGDDGGFLSGIGDWLGENPEKAALGATAALSLLGGAGDDAKAGDAEYKNINDPAYAEQVRQGFDTWNVNPEAQAPGSDYNWYAYGQVPSFMFFDNAVQEAPGMKEGGALSAVERGNKSALAILGSVPKGSGGGQDDNVPAVLAHGEHVLDADLVSALGDGDNDEGHRKIEQMKKKIRKHKRSAPADRIPPRAKSPLEYLAGAR